MTIGIDLRPLNTGEKSGVEEYTGNLLAHLFFLDKKNQYKLFLSSFKKPRLNFEKLRNFPNIEIKYLPYPNKLLNLGFVLLKYPSLDQLLEGVDIFFSPNIIFTHLSSGVKQIITFHDLSFERHPEFFSLKRRIWHRLVFPASQAQKAQRIIAVSESTRNDLVQLYHLEPKKIKVIPSGLLKIFKPRAKNSPLVLKVKKKYNLPDQFILYLGTLEPRKNLAGLILAFNQFKKRERRDYKLVIAGKPGWLCHDVYKLARRSFYSRDIILTGFIDSLDKPYIYNLAEFFVYPSFYEGFGFPPLEAMASGIPVITSNITSLPEVAGDSALLVDPYNINEISVALGELASDPALRNSLREKGIRRAKKFSWLKTARETLNLFEEVSKLEL